MANPHMNDLDRIKQKIDIVDLIGGRLQLKKAGRNFKANCPFHGEKTPSFVISPERQIWHCFGCGKGGDIFAFVMEYENLTFAESLKELANQAGVKLTTSPARSQKEKLQEKIYALNHLSAQFYNYLLTSHPAGKKALKYLLDERRLSLPLINTFMLGYAPDNDALVKYLIGKKKYTEQDTLDAGLAFSRGRYVSDFFRGRIIFPIFDIRGNVVAFSGRGTTSEITPKYINTKETPVYTKGDTLYGIQLAKEEIKKEGKVILVEGEFDVITSFKEGITNIVAVKGTALTENQIKLLKRFTNKFALCFDQDPAGTQAQRRSIKLLEQEGIAITVIVPPEGKDPDELLNENPILFKKAVKKDVNVYDYIIDSSLVGSDKSTADGKKQILEKTLPYLSNIENEVLKEHYLKRLADLLDTSFESVLKQADKTREPNTLVQVRVPEARAQLPKEELLELYLASLVFQSQNPKHFLKLAREELGEIGLSTHSLEKLLISLEKYENTTFNIKEFAQSLPQELHLPLDTSYLSPIPEFDDEKKLEKEVVKTSKHVKELVIRKKLNDLSKSIESAEKEKDTSSLEKYEAEFDKYTSLLQTT